MDGQKIRPLLANTKLAIDIGTGTGDLVRRIETRGMFAGTDLSHDMLKVAKAKAKGKQFFVSDTYALPIANNVLDAVTYKYALHHLDKPVKSLRESARALKKGGIIIIADVASYDNQEIHNFFKKLNTAREPANYEYRSIKTIEGFFKRLGMETHKLETKEFNLVLEDWLHNFYVPDKTIPLVLNAPDKVKKALKLKQLPSGKHQITLTSFVYCAKKK